MRRQRQRVVTSHLPQAVRATIEERIRVEQERVEKSVLSFRRKASTERLDPEKRRPVESVPEQVESIGRARAKAFVASLERQFAEGEVWG